MNADLTAQKYANTHTHTHTHIINFPEAKEIYCCVELNQSCAKIHCKYKCASLAPDNYS